RDLRGQRAGLDVDAALEFTGFGAALNVLQVVTGIAARAVIRRERRDAQALTPLQARVVLIEARAEPRDEVADSVARDALPQRLEEDAAQLLVFEHRRGLLETRLRHVEPAVE